MRQVTGHFYRTTDCRPFEEDDGLGSRLDLEGGRKDDLTLFTPYPDSNETTTCVCVRVFFPFALDIKFVGYTSRGHTGRRSHRIFHPLSFCGACLNFSREKDSAIPFPRRS